MNSSSRKLRTWYTAPLILGLLSAFAIAACGDDEETIEIDGSSTVFPVSEAVAEEFGKIHSSVRVNVGVSGTGGGFKRFTAGDTDISDASRPIKDSEATLATENGVQYMELKVGTDGLSVMVNPQNDWAECLTVEELKKIWEPGSTISNWNQVRSDFPDRPLRLYGADTDSGTFDYFTEEIMGEGSGLSRSDYTASADDNVLVQGISGDRNALGYFGYAYYAENEDKLKLVAVDNGERVRGSDGGDHRDRGVYTACHGRCSSTFRPRAWSGLRSRHSWSSTWSTAATSSVKLATFPSHRTPI